MRRGLILIAAALLCAGCAGNRNLAGEPGVPAARVLETQRALRHVVLFRFKEGTTPEQVKTIEDAFRALPGKITAVRDFEWGVNVSPENLSQGYTHCFFVTFASEADRDAYLPHPAHKAFGAVLGPHLDKALVLDYWTRK